MSSKKQLDFDVRLITLLNIMVVGLAELDKDSGVDPAKNPATVVCVNELNSRLQKYIGTDDHVTLAKRVRRAKKAIAMSPSVTNADADLLVVAAMRLLSSFNRTAKPGTALGFISSQFSKNIELLEGRLTPDQKKASGKIRSRVRSVLSSA